LLRCHVRGRPGYRGRGDLRARVGRQEVPVLGLDWIDEGEGRSARWEDYEAAVPAGLSELREESVVAPASPVADAGRLVVFFVQADLEPSRISGQLRMRPYTRRLLATRSGASGPARSTSG